MPQANEPVISSHWKVSTAQAPMKEWAGSKNRSSGLVPEEISTEPLRPLPAMVIQET